MEQQQQFLQLFLDHERSLKAYIGALVREPQLRDEIFQEVALALCSAFKRYQPDSPFSSWARGVARNKILKLWEKRKKESMVFSTDALDAIDRAFETTEAKAGGMNEALRHCVGKLPQHSQDLLALRYEESLKLNEIAEKMDRTLSAAHKALSRIRSSLKDCMRRRLAQGGLS